MKLLTVAIPCYNSESYMEHAVETALCGGEEIEILLVNDGSTDKTAEIADRLAAEHPTIIKAIHKENGGHGSAVNAGLANASGIYYKVLDSDDWFDEQALIKVMDILKGFVKDGKGVDMFLANYVYEKPSLQKHKAIRYGGVFPQNEIFTWSDVGRFKMSQNILMHSVIYRTEMLKLCQLELPKHTFYVDNIYVYYPLPHVRTLYYLNVDFYRYFIGREDQSVNEKVMIGRIDQQLFVTKRMIEMYELRMITSKKLRKYMINYLAIMMTVSSILCIRSKKQENLVKKKELWAYLKKKDYKTYVKIRYGILGQTMNLPGRSGRKVSSLAYSVARRLIGFN